MLIGVKQCVERNDLRGLHYIFAEALEADPTFEKYQEDYEYCKKLPGFLEAHEELHLQQNDPAAWDETYWAQLKLDQKKNFSEKRMEHMKKVASVVRKEKIERLRAERARLAGTAAPEKPRQTAQPRTERTVAPTTPPTEAARATPLQPVFKGVVESNPSEEKQKQQIEKSKSRYAVEYQQDLAREQRTQKEQEGQGSKKQLGVVLIVVAVLLMAIVAFLLSNPGSTAA